MGFTERQGPESGEKIDEFYGIGIGVYGIGIGWNGEFAAFGIGGTVGVPTLWNR